MTKAHSKKNRLDDTPTIQAIDLFCGAGGLTKGLEKAGINVKLGIDIDPSCQYPYSQNNNANFLLKSVENIDGLEIDGAYSEQGLKLLAGCAPCQTFSSYNKKATPSDTRWWLLLHFSRLIQEVQPDLITMENVPGLLKQGVFSTFLSSLEKQNYNICYNVVDCAQYGLPQQRLRLVLLASRLGPIEMLKPSFHTRTVRDAIGILRPIKAGSIDINDPMHQSSRLSPLNYKRILASSPGGSWRDWPKELIADCHKKQSGKTYPSVYGRMKWDEPSPTITTQFFGFGNGRFGHPEQNRALSLREGALLQGFPKSYEFTPPGKTINKKILGRLIGNAVPPKLGEVIGKSLLAHVRETDSPTNN